LLIGDWLSISLLDFPSPLFAHLLVVLLGSQEQMKHDISLSMHANGNIGMVGNGSLGRLGS